MIRNIAIATLIMAASSTSLLAEQPPSVNKLQRLFTTPLERAQLDAMRRRNEFGVEQDSPDKPVPVLPPMQVELKGVVMRKNAPNVAWVNDGNTLKSRQIDDRIRVNPESIVKNRKIPVMVNDKKVRLQPGQVWNEFDNEVKDKYQVDTTTTYKNLKNEIESMNKDKSGSENSSLLSD